ncbi:M14 family metallopeptidase [candidate division KSB1 bacterium]|nr:M14 family metallopeptidase [candidate division KSB1 bacterium]
MSRTRLAGFARCITLAVLFANSATAFSQEHYSSAARQAILPPELKWNGKSAGLIAAPNDPWITPVERSDFQHTPTYEETTAWLTKLVAAAPELKMLSLGKSPEGRELWMVVASQERAFTPAALRATGKPILFAQAGIHAGEIDGKDAGMMLLRDMTVRNKKRDLLAQANLLFVPIFNVDGHERSSPYNRINQRGPRETGWRTTARNLNLNRDYAKADAPEMRALLRALNEWDPDFYMDIHVTDGADYQYDITYGYTGKHGYSPAIAAWLDEAYTPAVNRDLQAFGHIPGPLVNLIDDREPQRGMVNWTAPPRFSHGYGDARHLPTVLIENHSLKPFKQRVLGTYVLLESTMRVLAKEGKKLRAAIHADRSRRVEEVPLAWRVPQQQQPGMFEFWGVEPKVVSSPITNSEYVQWTGKTFTQKIPYLHMSEPALSARRPIAYLIPPVWEEVLARLGEHGVQMERLAAPFEREVELYRLREAKLGAQPFEGRVNVTAKPQIEKHKQTFPSGTVRVKTDQPLGTLAMLLLEPESGDSFFQWGFFLEVLSPTEYVESYVMQPMAERMLAEDAALKTEFEQALKADSTFANSPREKLQWLYRRTPFFDAQWQLYPVAREW